MKFRLQRHHALLTEGIDDLPAHERYHIKPVAREVPLLPKATTLSLEVRFKWSVALEGGVERVG